MDFLPFDVWFLFPMKTSTKSEVMNANDFSKSSYHEICWKTKLGIRYYSLLGVRQCLPHYQNVSQSQKAQQLQFVQPLAIYAIYSLLVLSLIFAIWKRESAHSLFSVLVGNLCWKKSGCAKTWGNVVMWTGRRFLGGAFPKESSFAKFASCEQKFAEAR